MAPAQLLAVAEELVKPKITIKFEEVNGDCKDKKDDGLGLIPENNCEDSGLFYGDSLAVCDKVDNDVLDQEVDIVVCVDGEVVVVEPQKAEDPHAMEYSSSFGNTFSGSDDEVRMSASDLEVDSQFSMENEEQPGSDDYSLLFKKKKVTAHWRRYIILLMWRCRWLELRMNELRSQALLYDKELERYRHKKHLHSKMIELIDSVSRSVPLPCQSYRKRAMKRRKRKRNEETVNISSYMSNHNIFSYSENKRSETDGHLIDDAGDIQAVDEIMKGTNDHEWSVLGFKGGHKSLEQILLNIEALQSRVLNLKTQLSKVCRTSRDISSTAGIFWQGDPPTSFAQSHSCSPGNNPMYHASDYEEEIAVPGSAVSSYGDAADVNMIEGTANAARNHCRLGDMYKDSADDVLIDNKAADEDVENFEASRGREKRQLRKEAARSCSEDESIAPKVLMEEPGPGGQSADVQQPPALKPCYTRKKRGQKPKRKRRGGSVAGSKNKRKLN